MTTIRLSDRLELRADAESHLIRTLILDGEHAGIVYASAESAIVALANPPRYDLPPGVIHGLDGKFYAPGDVVRTLPDEMWTRHAPGMVAGWANRDATGHVYEVRPTAANPLQPLPAYTFRLPDGELACYRRDAAKLREAGATLTTTTDGDADDWFVDAAYPDQVLLVEFPAPPETKRVHWVVALRGQLPLTHNSGPITSYIARPDARATNPVGIDLGPEGDGDNRCVCPDALGKVEVLASDGAL